MGSGISVLEELRKIQAAKLKGARCSISLVLKSLQKEDCSALEQAMGDPTIDSTTISVWLERNGQKVARHTVARHRRRECQCQ